MGSPPSARSASPCSPGTVTGLIGPNGAGKTTLFNVISGLQAPSRGSVHLFDTDVTTMKPHRRARLGLARTFQRLELFGSLTAGRERAGGAWSPRSSGGSGAICAGRYRGSAAGRRRTGTHGQPRSAGIGGRRHPRPPPRGGRPRGSRDHQSASHVHRIWPGWSSWPGPWPSRPKLLLLDEPGSGLDEAESTGARGTVGRLAAGGMAVLLVEHDMELVMRICDHIYVLDFGDIIASGTPEEIRGGPDGPGRLPG